jgi:hypothetical protein
VSVFHNLIGIPPGWSGIKSLIKVERVGTRSGKKYHEIICYIISLMQTAQEFAQGIRGHWGIENRLSTEMCIHGSLKRGGKIRILAPFLRGFGGFAHLKRSN